MRRHNFGNDELSGYVHTSYNVFPHGGSPTVSIHIGHKHPQVDALLLGYDVHPRAWAFVSAYGLTPSSRAASESETARDLAMYGLIRRRVGWVSLQGMAISDFEDDALAPRPSHLVMGIVLSDAVALANQYSQRAIIYGTLEGDAELVDCALSPQPNSKTEVPKEMNDVPQY